MCLFTCLYVIISLICPTILRRAYAEKLHFAIEARHDLGKERSENGSDGWRRSQAVEDNKEDDDSTYEEKQDHQNGATGEEKNQNTASPNINEQIHILLLNMQKDQMDMKKRKKDAENFRRLGCDYNEIQKIINEE